MSGQFFRNAVFLSLVEIILKLKGFIFIPLLTRHFGAIEYGVWSQVGVLVSTLSPLIVLGTDSAFIRYLPGKSLEIQKSQYSAWCIFLLMMSAGSFTLILTFEQSISQIFFGSSADYALYLPVAAFSLCTSIAINTLRNWHRIHNNAEIYGYIAIFQAILNTLAVVIMLTLNKGVLELVLYSLAADALVIIWLLLHITISYGWARPDFSIIAELVKYGLPLVPAGYAMWGLNSMDRLFLIKYSTLADIGVYSLCYSLGYMVIQIFVNPIWNMFPNTAAELYNQNKMYDIQRLFDRSIGIILLITLPSIVGIAILGNHLLLILTTSQFSSGAPVWTIITIGYLFHMLASYYDIIMGLTHRQLLSTLSISAAFLVNLVLNILLIPEYGILGAATATALGFVSQFIISLFAASFYTKIKTNIIFPVKILIVSLIMGVFLNLLSSLNPSVSISVLLMMIASGIFIYASLLFLFGFITIHQVKSFRKIFKQA